MTRTEDEAFSTSDDLIELLADLLAEGRALPPADVQRRAFITHVWHTTLNELNRRSF